MFKSMRRADRALNKEAFEAILGGAEYGVLSLNGSDGYPYGVPVNYIYRDGRILFHCALEGDKIDRIEQDSRVCFSVVGRVTVLPDKFSTSYESVIAFGKAEQLSGAEKREALVGVIDKYSGDYHDSGMQYIDKMLDKTAVFAINIEHVTGKARPK